jgi:hypothetical protein
MEKRIVKHLGDEIEKREELAYKFYRLILEVEEYPDMVDDWDYTSTVCSNIKARVGEDSEKYLIDTINKCYGVEIDEDFFCREFWLLLDYLEEEQERQKNQKLLPKL